MRQVTLGRTGITTPQNAFGALPIQRVPMKEAVEIFHKAVEGGMTYIDTARAYSDSEEKLGNAFGGAWDGITLATKTRGTDPDAIRRDLETSLKLLKRDDIDVYQLHMVSQCYKPEDGTGVYECLCDLKRQGLIRHIGITTHKQPVAFEIVESGLYETLQFPFSYLSSEKDMELVRKCKEAGIGFIAMKGLAGGLINRSAAAMAFLEDFDNVVPIWGIQRMSELEEWLSYMKQTPAMDDEMRAFIQGERDELSGDFCRGCGYCMPCPQGIEINNCARMSLMLRRAPSAAWLTQHWQDEMAKIDSCVNCGTCMSRCPYELNTPELLRKNLEDYRKVLAGEVKVC